MKAILFCGGKGRRMFPFSEFQNKCLLPVGNIPLIEHWLKALTDLHFDEIVLMTGEKNRGFSAILAKYKNTREVLAISAQQQLELLEQEAAEEPSLLLANGDGMIAQSDLARLLESWRIRGNSLLIDSQSPFRAIDCIGASIEKNQVRALVGHGRPHYVQARSLSCAVVDQTVLKYLKIVQLGFHNIPCGGMPDQSFYLEELLQVALEENVTIAAAEVQKEAVDLDFPWDLLRANQLAAQDLAGLKTRIAPTAALESGAVIQGAVEIGEGSVIEAGAMLEGNCRIGARVRIERGAKIGANCIVGDGTIIQSGARIQSQTVLGKNVKVGFGAELSGVFMDGVAAVHGCEVYGVVGRHVDIAAGVITAILRFDDQQVINQVEGKRYQNAYTNAVFIGDETRTGIGNLFYPGVKVGAHCALGPGLIVDEDIASHQLVLPKKQEKSFHEWSSRRYGW